MGRESLRYKTDKEFKQDSSQTTEQPDNKRKKYDKVLLLDMTLPPYQEFCEPCRSFAGGLFLRF